MISSFDAWRTPAYKVGCALPSARGANPTFAGWHPIWHAHRREHRQAARAATPLAASETAIAGVGRGRKSVEAVPKNQNRVITQRGLEFESITEPSPDYALGTGLLISAESVERLEYRTDLLSVLGIWVDVLKATNQREIFGTQFFLQFVYFMRQLLSFRGVFLLVDLITQLGNFTVCLGLELVAADDFDDILCIRLQLGSVRRLTLRIQGHGGDC